jgi:hypothetical protein
MPLLKVNQIASYSGNTLTVGTTGDTVTLAAGASSSGFGATYNSGLNWTSTLVTSALTLTAGTGYFVNTSTAAITVTLPASPTFGSIVGINDYSGYASTNNIIINPNGNKLEGGTSNKLISTNKESVILNYVDSTRGWLPTSGVNNGTDALSPSSYSVDFLVIAGGGGGGTLGGGGGAGGYRTSTQTVNGGTVITVTVGDGGAGSTGALDSANRSGSVGSNSSISGSGLTTITSAGGGFGGGWQITGGNGGSGGGTGSESGSAGGSGNTPNTSPSQGNNGGLGLAYASGSPNYGASGGGGASAVGGNATTTAGGNGGAGTASSITGSSVTRAGGGGGGTNGGGTAGSGGSGGGGAGTTNNTTASSATVNTGSGGGGGGYSGVPGGLGGAGGKGVVILSMPDGNYTGTTTGSPTVATGVSGKTVLTFTGSGSYTG